MLNDSWAGLDPSRGCSADDDDDDDDYDYVYLLWLETWGAVHFFIARAHKPQHTHTHTCIIYVLVLKWNTKSKMNQLLLNSKLH